MNTVEISNVYSLLDPPLWLVTSAHGSQRGGFIATTVTRASIVAEIPRQLITVNKRHHTHTLIEASGAFGLHLIDETQIELAWRFGLQSGRDIDKLTDVLPLFTLHRPLHVSPPVKIVTAAVARCGVAL